MHSALVSAIVSSTVRWLHLNCEWFTDNAPHEFFAAKTFCELVNFWGRNFTCDLIIAKLNCVYFLFRTLCHSVCQSELFEWYFRKIDFWKIFTREKFLYHLKIFLNCRREIFWSEKIFLDERKSLKNLEKTFWLIQNFYKVEDLDSKAERSWTQTGTQHLCITNKQLSVHVSSVEKDVAINKDGYSIQLAEWKRGNRGELFAAEPAPSRAVRSSVPHLGIATAWARSPGE